MKRDSVVYCGSVREEGPSMKVAVISDTHDHLENIEAAICGFLPEAMWGRATHLFIFHGRRTCHARQPACAACSLRTLCPWSGTP